MSLSASSNLNLDQQEIDTLQKQVLDLYLSGESEKVEQLPLFQKYEKLFSENENAYSQYLSSVDIADTEKVNLKLEEIHNSQLNSLNTQSQRSSVNNTVVNPKGELVIIMEDGSAALLRTTMLDENGNPVTSNNPYNDIAPAVANSTVNGWNMSGFKGTWENELVILLSATMKTKAYYTVGSKMNVTDYNHSGTSGSLGTTVKVTHTLKNNNTALVTLKSEFELTNKGNSYYTLYSTFKFNSAYQEDNGYWWVDYTLSAWDD